MAAPPRQRQWNIEVPPDMDWLSDALPELNSFISSVTYALTQQLSRADNFRSMKKIVKINTSNSDNFPLNFECTLGAPPDSIRIGQIRIITPNGVLSGPNTCAAWELFDGATIRLYGITGLADNTEYEITLIVE